MKTFVAAIALALSTGCAPSVVEHTIALSPTINHYTPTEGDKMGSAMKLLTERLEEGGYTVDVLGDEEVRFRNGGETAYGLHFRRLKLIVLNADVPLNAQFETLAHEAGHIFHGPIYVYAVAEVFAELVGNRVQRYYGSTTAVRTSSEYLAQFKYAFATLPYLQKDMDFAVDVLTGKKAWPKVGQ